MGLLQVGRHFRNLAADGTAVDVVAAALVDGLRFAVAAVADQLQ